MPWPEKVLRQFQQVPVNPAEVEFHGPYNKLLNVLFPPDTDFTVVPQYLPGSRESADFVIEVLLDDSPVFVLGIRAPNQLRYHSTRGDADKQSLCSRVWVLIASIAYCPLPILHGVSVMGTRLCFYKLPRDGAIEPPLIQAHPELVMDTAPRER
ncbi:hypothetical protein BJV78DRAFT_1189440 [Lactifluus subvellereus]|nr:hypothetical protein BJV78DRAFT_1189440 [Lactifluus subvellereus]